jgi:hypothetical protein
LSQSPRNDVKSRRGRSRRPDAADRRQQPVHRPVQPVRHLHRRPERGGLAVLRPVPGGVALSGARLRGLSGDRHLPERGVLRQRGAAHSRKSDEEKTGEEKTGEEKAGEEKTAKDRQAETLRAADEDDKRPGPPPASSRRRLTTNFQFNPLRKNWLYNNSLSLALFGLFVLFFALHAWTSNRAYNEEQMLRHQQVQALLPYLGSSTFWFSCFQTWEAEFFAIGVYIVLSIFLRQERSPESKKPDAGDADTGDTND